MFPHTLMMFRDVLFSENYSFLPFLYQWIKRRIFISILETFMLKMLLSVNNHQVPYSVLIFYCNRINISFSPTLILQC